MDDIIKRGLFERKILRKSVPNNVLFLKAFYHQVVTAEDLENFSVHSVATLLQDALWGCKERILSKKIWRQINYETCTLEYLFTILPQQNYQLLTDIVHFLVNVMKHKRDNLMDAYHLGDAMGKVALGPADCDPILAEKAGHFLMRMIIEESKQQKRISVSHACPTRISLPTTTMPIPTTTPTLTKTEAAKAKAKSYNRILQRRKIQQYDWTASDIGLKALHDGYPPSPPEKPYHSIFDTTLANDSKSELAYASPILFRILVNANQNATSAINNNNTNYDDSPQSSFFDIDSISQGKTKTKNSNCSNNKEERVAHSLCHAFDDVQEWLTRYQQQYPRSHDAMAEKPSFRPLAKLNRSLTYLKTKNLQQQQQQQQRQRMNDLFDPWYMDDSGISQDTLTLSRGGSTLYAKHTSTIPSIDGLSNTNQVNNDSSVSTMSDMNNTSGINNNNNNNNNKNRLLTMRQMITDQHKKLSLSIRRDPLVY
ncbi:unnamed protein product [Absidia cylindrospora]